jgi:hypothetical protein
MAYYVLSIVPPKPLFSKISNIMKTYSHKLSSKDALKLPPHLTVVSRFTTSQFEELSAEIIGVLKKVKPFELQLTSIYYFTDPKLIYLTPKMTPQIKKLHEQMLKLVTKYRDPWTRPSLQRTDVDPLQKQYIEQYGSPYVMEYYHPHLSIAGADVNNEAFEKIINTLPKKINLGFKVAQLSVMIKDESGWNIGKPLLFQQE